MKGITGFRLRGEVARKDQTGTDSAIDTEARSRLIAKLRAMGPDKFDAMSEREYDDWLDALPQDEFIALLQLPNE